MRQGRFAKDFGSIVVFLVGVCFFSALFHALWLLPFAFVGPMLMIWYFTERDLREDLNKPPMFESFLFNLFGGRMKAMEKHLEVEAEYVPPVEGYWQYKKKSE